MLEITFYTEPPDVGRISSAIKKKRERERNEGGKVLTQRGFFFSPFMI